MTRPLPRFDWEYLRNKGVARGTKPQSASRIGFTFVEANLGSEGDSVYQLNYAFPRIEPVYAFVEGQCQGAIRELSYTARPVGKVPMLMPAL